MISSVCPAVSLTMQSGDYAYSIATCEVNSPTTEDCYSILTSTDISLFIVLDGHGGSFASKYAALHLPSIIMTHLTDLVKSSDLSVTPTTCSSNLLASAADVPIKVDLNAIADCLYRSFCQCDQEILTIAIAQHTPSPAPGITKGKGKGPRYASVGSCCSLVLLVKGVMFTAHCG